MSQTKTRYIAKVICNDKVEWLLEYGKINEICYFKGAVGDRYTIYVATKRTKNILDFHSIYNTYSYDTTEGTHIATLDKNYILRMIKEGNTWYSGCGNTLKQLMRQGIIPKANNYDIRYCRSSYMIRFRDKARGKVLQEVAPWQNMKIDLKTGTLVNKPTKQAQRSYNKAKAEDIRMRKLNYLSNKNNREALDRYRKAGGNTQQARAAWHNGRPVEIVDPTLETMNWDLVPMNDVFKHRNATLRSNIIEHYGMNAIIATLDYDIVDEDTIDGRKYKLLNVTIPDFSVGRDGQTIHKGLYLEMLNPSTGESHFEGVANVGPWSGLGEATVKEALKWRDGDVQITNSIKGTHGSDGASLDYISPEVLT